MSGADRGTWAARRKLQEAISRIRAEGAKNPGPLKRVRDAIATLGDTVQKGQADLAALERDRSMLAAAREGPVKALAHITGGGLLENVPRVLPEGVVAEIDARAWPLPPVFPSITSRRARRQARRLSRVWHGGRARAPLTALPER